MRIALMAASGALLLAQTPSFRTTTRLIQVNVIVTDHHGDPVTGLTKDDFTLLDQGRQQKIVFFSEQNGTNPTAAPEPRESKLFSNRAEEKPGAASSATVVLFDRLNTKLSETSFARERLLRFLEGIRPDDRLALYGLSDRLVVLHDFTEDPAALVRALQQYNPVQSTTTAATTFSESNTGHPGMDWFQNKGDQKMSDTLMIGRVEMTAQALEAIAHHLAGLPGRKNLVWVSGAFPISIGYLQKRIMGARPEKDDYAREVETAARALSNANVAIYPVDAHILGTLGSIYDASKAPKPGYGMLQTTVPLPETQSITELATMDTLAEMTGGKVFSANNDIEGMVRRAIDDSKFTYTLAYYPDHDKWNGEFREIKIRVKQPGVEVRARKGYLAIAENAPAPAAMSITQVLAQPVESSELGISATVERAGSDQFRFHMRIDAAGLKFEQKDGRANAALEVQWVQLDAGGHDVGSHGQMLTFRLSPETFASTERDGLKISFAETIDARATELRFAARDPVTGISGSVYIPVRSLK